jgi:hypothetical protein
VILNAESSELRAAVGMNFFFFFLKDRNLLVTWHFYDDKSWMAILMLAFLSSPVGWLVGMNLATRLDPGIVSRDEGESLTENAFNIQLRSWNGCVGIKLIGILPW